MKASVYSPKPSPLDEASTERIGSSELTSNTTESSELVAVAVDCRSWASSLVWSLNVTNLAKSQKTRAVFSNLDETAGREPNCFMLLKYVAVVVSKSRSCCVVGAEGFSMMWPNSVKNGVKG